MCFIDNISPTEINGLPNTLRVTTLPLFTTTVFDLIQFAKDFTSDKFCSHLDSNITGSGFAYSASSLLTYSRVPEDPKELPYTYKAFPKSSCRGIVVDELFKTYESAPKLETLVPNITAFGFAPVDHKTG